MPSSISTPLQAEVARDLGLRGWWMGYFAARFAPLGPHRARARHGHGLRVRPGHGGQVPAGRLGAGLAA